ncbi:hypothetical protein BD560DRAFT_423380 [Blakeslea trispora]|nr:hypothetical protein BD560DRAFT_423380 [Blakeslea trispora]
MKGAFFNAYAFECYVKGEGQLGNQVVRDFVWSESSFFQKGDESCTYHCIEWFSEGLSTRVRSLFSINPVFEFSHCSRNVQDSFIEEKQMVGFMLGSYPTIKDYQAANQLRKEVQERRINTLRIQFREAYHKQVLYKTKEGLKCRVCGEKSVSRGTLIPQESLPKFLLFVDPVRYVPGNKKLES